MLLNRFLVMSFLGVRDLGLVISYESFLVMSEKIV